MAEALADGLQSAFAYLDLHAYDVHEKRKILFEKQFDATPHGSPEECIVGADVILLATKPQNFQSLGAQLKGRIDERSIVLSILAGTKIDTLVETLGHSRVVRSMPNTPAAVQEGVTVWTATETMTPDDRALASKVLRAFGEEVMVDEERYLDVATAVSGSGPAYILLMMEAMIDTGVHMGFPREVATKIVLQTFRGTAVYAGSQVQQLGRASNATPTSLRADITSPGGTTASALYQLKQGRFETTVADGLWAAYNRSVELGGGKRQEK
jgi:pyrroline-5-carboxylate reductase